MSIEIIKEPKRVIEGSRGIFFKEAEIMISISDLGDDSPDCYVRRFNIGWGPSKLPTMQYSGEKIQSFDDAERWALRRLRAKFEAAIKEIDEYEWAILGKARKPDTMDEVADCFGG